MRWHVASWRYVTSAMQIAKFVALARYDVGVGARRMLLTLVHRSDDRMDDLRMISRENSMHTLGSGRRFTCSCPRVIYPADAT